MSAAAAGAEGMDRGATARSFVMSQSGTPSPFRSWLTRMAWSSVTGNVAVARVVAPTRVRLSRVPTLAVSVTFPKGTITL